MKTQYDVVLAYLKKHKKGITSYEAFSKFGITRLSSIIYNLRKDGYSIIVDSKTVKNRYGNHTTIAIYKLEG